MPFPETPATLTSSLGRRGPAIESLALCLLEVFESEPDHDVLEPALKLARVLHRVRDAERYDDEKAARDREELQLATRAVGLGGGA